MIEATPCARCGSAVQYITKTKRQCSDCDGMPTGKAWRKAVIVEENGQTSWSDYWKELLGEDVAYCKSCGAPIVYLLTRNEVLMPVDAETIQGPEDVKSIFDHTRHRSHFASCPNSNEHRKQGSGSKAN